MSKLFHRAIKIDVREDMQHRPISFIYRGRTEKIEQVARQWRVTQWWWKKAIEREYFQIGTEAGIICELYRDLLSGHWYLQRIQD
jgi:hypothetical protein